MTETTYSTERLGALSDGVFAIILTLLVLELKVPQAASSEERLLEALAGNLPELLA